MSSSSSSDDDGHSTRGGNSNSKRIKIEEETNDTKVLKTSATATASAPARSLLPKGILKILTSWEAEKNINHHGLILESNINNNAMTSHEACTLFDFLKTSNSRISELSLMNNFKLDDKCMKSLGEYIKSNKNIEIIDMSSTSISNTGIEILAPYIEGNLTLQCLRFNLSRRISDRSTNTFVKMIESSNIQDLSIKYSSLILKNPIAVSLTHNLMKNRTSKIDCFSQNVNDNDVVKICEYMRKYGIEKLKEIELSYCEITSKGASALFDTLKECNSAVSTMNLSGNQLDDECMKQLGEYLQDNEHVELLVLGKNKITDKGVEILSEYLIGNTTLEELRMYDNEGITDVSFPYLIEMVNKSCITILDVRYPSISKENEREIYAALSIPIDEREIPIRSNSKSAAKIST